MKICLKCKEDKEVDQFHNRKKGKDGLCDYCKSCIREKNKLSAERIRKGIPPRNKRTPEEIKKYYRIWQSNRKKKDNKFKLYRNIRNLIRNGLLINNHRKNSKTKDILGCSIEDFKKYIELKWEPWMNWTNHGKYNRKDKFGWDLDHIIPISSAKTEEEIIKLNHYSNFQPLCSKINRFEKRNKIESIF